MNRNFDGQKLIDKNFVSSSKIEIEMLKEPFHSFFADVIGSLEITERNYIKINLETNYDSILDAEDFSNATKEAETCIGSSRGLIINLHKRMIRGWSEAALEFANYLLDYLLYKEDICFEKKMASGIKVFKKDKGYTAEMIQKLYEKERHSDQLAYEAATLYLDFYTKIRNCNVHVKGNYDLKKMRYFATHKSYPREDQVIDAIRKYEKVLKKINQKINNY